MSMTNFRDLSTTVNDVNAGFQFEFFCELTEETWKSPFRPYRRAQMTAWLSRATTMFHSLYGANRALGYAAEAGIRSAKAEALAEAQEMAAKRFRQCEQCSKWVALAVWDEDSGTCTGCRRGGGARRSSGGGRAAAYQDEDDGDQAGGSALRCPSCQVPSQGGRFCHECGFDMASTFKSCPGCGTTLARQARFCTDCGHAF